MPQRPPPPGPIMGPVIGTRQLEDQAAILERQVQSGRRRSLLLAAGVALTLLLGAGLWAWHRTATVLSYAQLDPAIRLERQAADADRLTLTYRPTSSGKVGFRRRDQDRETELLDEVAGDGEQQLDWRWQGVQEGDVLKVVSRRGWSLHTDELQVPAAPPRPPLGRAIVQGQVVNATNNTPLAGAQVRLVGTPLSAVTDQDGKFRVTQAPEGLAAIEVAAANFSTDQLERELQPDQPTELRVALSPGMEAGQIRVVLTWGDQPADLDAHLEGPLPNEQRFHVFHKQKGDLTSREFVSLDVDDRDGQGPETITVLGVLPGNYHFFVHNASSVEGQEQDKYALARSGAEVKIYQGGQTYRFRANNESAGNLWHVCDIDVTPQGATVKRLERYEFATAEQSQVYGKYAMRTLANRQQWVGLYGGTADSELAVQQGLNWLARHQAEDGHWDNDCLRACPGGCCEEGPACSTSGDSHAMPFTGLALLAFQAGGHYYFNNQKYSEVVRRGVEWLVEQQREDGGLYGSPSMYEHGIATFALADACATAVASQSDVESRYRKAAENAVHLIVECQKPDGGWRYSPDRRGDSDTSVSGWQVLALEAAKEAEIKVDPGCLQRAVAYFQTCQIGDSGRTGYQGSHQISEATSGVGMLVHAFLLEKPDDDWCRRGGEYLAQLAEQQWGNNRVGPKDYYLWYNCTLAMCQHGGELWKRWNDVVREHVLRLQNKDEQSCLRGSWDWQGDCWGSQGGRIYTTALATLTLEVYYRYSSDRAKVYDEKPVSAPPGEKSGGPGPKQ